MKHVGATPPWASKVVGLRRKDGHPMKLVRYGAQLEIGEQLSFFHILKVRIIFCTQ
jgi:hypothetical protein